MHSLQAEFSLLDFKATDESTKVELPLYIEVKGERVSSGCGSLTVGLLLLMRHLRRALSASHGILHTLIQDANNHADRSDESPSLSRHCSVTP